MQKKPALLALFILIHLSFLAQMQIQSDDGEKAFDKEVFPLNRALLDAGVAALLTPEVPFTSGQQTIAARIKNFGTDILSSLTIEWKYNGDAQTPVNWAGSLAPGDTIDVDLGSILLLANQANEIIAWTSNPNNMTDTETFNDTSVVNNLYAGLSGIYTLGGGSADFNNFTEAVYGRGR